MPTSFVPCCVQIPPLLVKTHAAPVFVSSTWPPRIAVSPSEESATEKPCCAAPVAPVPTSFAPCCVQTPAFLVNTQAAPTLVLSRYPPRIAVLPLEERATETPRAAAPVSPVPTSFAPCCVQTPALLVKTHAAPAFPLSAGPPTRAVLPSAERATECPSCGVPTAPLPTSFGPEAKSPAPADAAARRRAAKDAARAARFWKLARLARGSIGHVFVVAPQTLRVSPADLDADDPKSTQDASTGVRFSRGFSSTSRNRATASRALSTRRWRGADAGRRRSVRGGCRGVRRDLARPRG